MERCTVPRTSSSHGWVLPGTSPGRARPYCAAATVFIMGDRTCCRRLDRLRPMASNNRLSPADYLPTQVFDQPGPVWRRRLPAPVWVTHFRALAACACLARTTPTRASTLQ